VTSMRDDATFTKAMELGAAAVLTKPLRGEELLAEVARVLRGLRKETGRDAEK
jgi:DNA-binding response OmpR family regulator